MEDLQTEADAYYDYQRFRTACPTIAYALAQDIVDMSESIKHTGNIVAQTMWFGLPKSLYGSNRFDYMGDLRLKLALTIAERDKEQRKALRLQEVTCNWKPMNAALRPQDELLARMCGFDTDNDTVVTFTASLTVVRHLMKARRVSVGSDVQFDEE